MVRSCKVCNLDLEKKLNETMDEIIALDLEISLIDGAGCTDDRTSTRLADLNAATDFLA